MLSKKIELFNSQIINSQELQTTLNQINSPIDLINLAKAEGFDLTREDLKELAQNAYQEWSNQLNETTRLFFDKVHVTPELNQKLHHCNSKQDIINLAEQCGFILTESDLDLAVKIAYSIKGFSFEKIFFQNKLGHNNFC